MDQTRSELRICRSCGELKPLEDFDLRADTGRRRPACKTCRRSYQQSRYQCTTDMSRSRRIIGVSDLYVCRRCNEMKPAEEFPRRATASHRLHSWCRSCFSTYKAERHVRHHDREMSRIRRNQERVVRANRERILEYLATHPCVDCGESDPIVLDFDHLRDKCWDVSALVYSGRKWQMILDEIAKCQVRCANDHRRATRKRHVEGKTRRLP